MLRTSRQEGSESQARSAFTEPSKSISAGRGAAWDHASGRLFDGASFRWLICGLLFLATSINYMDRQVMAILAPILQGKFGWNEEQYGHLVFAFQLAYMIGLLGVGWFIDRCGLKVGYVFAIAVWSLAACATALTTTLLGFAAARFALGLGEAGNFPAATKTVGEWFPRRERSLATGLFNTGTSSGAIIAPLLVPWIVRTWNWEMAFIVLGASGFVWIVLWLLFYQRPEKSRYLSEADVSFIRTDDDPEIALLAANEDVGRVHWLELFRFPQTWGILISAALVVPVMWFQIFWLPKFLGSRFKVSISQAGWPLATAFSMQLIGSILGGVLATWLISKGKSVHFARKFSLGLCAICVIPIAFVGLIPLMWPAILVVGFAMAAMQGWSANSYSITTDLYPKRAIASMVGLGTAAGAIGSMAFAEFAGWYLQHTGGNYSLLFVLAGCGFPCAFLAVHMFIPRWQVVVLEDQVGPQNSASHDS
jgi:ACS family hexuronate transporter-like MFS transporter